MTVACEVSSGTTMPASGSPGPCGRLNRYAYALNNPLNMSDPAGEDGCGDDIDCGDEVGGAFGFVDSSDYWVS